MNLHPIIQESQLPQETKEFLKHLLEDEFNSDWNLLLESMMEHVVGDEEYELAAEIRDYLKKYK